MAVQRPERVWVIWLTFVVGLLLSVMPMPDFMQIGRPLWIALLLTYWSLYLPHRVGMFSAWGLGLACDVLAGNVLGQNALVLVLIVFLVQTLQRRLRMFPLWQQSLVLLVVFGLAQLVHLWLGALTGNRTPTLLLVLPALVSAVLWPWFSSVMRALHARLGLH